MSKVAVFFKVAGAVAASALFQMIASAQNYTMALVTSDGSVAAANTDPNLVNPWGLSRSTNGPWWVSDNNSGKSTLYLGSGVPQSLVVTIPPGNGSGVGSPTGTIFNGSTDFALTPNNPAIFLFATEDGTISGWNPAVNPSTAVIMVNNSNAVYKGLTAGIANGTQYLYVPNFRSGAVEVYDTNFKPVTLPIPPQTGIDAQFGRFFSRGVFEAPGAVTRGLVPFNIQNIGGTLFIAYAKQDTAKHDDVPGAGLGYVASFTTEGRLIREFAFGSYFNAPWGLALAPSDFGTFSHNLLVGQFGSGAILAFNVETGAYTGTLADQNSNPISIPGLWGISFGASPSASGNFNSLFFAAGPNEEANGVLGTLTPTSAELTQGNDL